MRKVPSTVCSLFAGLVLAGCAIGAPPGFSSGDQWSFPLVDPLADGKLVTPVYIDGRGPFLFAIDPDSPTSVADESILAGGPFMAHRGPRFVDEHDTSHPTFYAPVVDMSIGNLTISLRTLRMSEHDGAFDSDGRRIYGIVGRDVIEDSLVFGFDRDRGIAWLCTQEVFQRPAGSTALRYFKGTRDRGDLVVRRLVTGSIDGARYDLHLDLGEVTSQLVPGKWDEAKLRAADWPLSLVDEAGTQRSVSQVGIADRVTVQGVTRDGIGFAPYADRRWWWGQLEGTLGLDFFRPYSVAADWHHTTYYLTPRASSPRTTALRLARWGSTMTSTCRRPGCIDAAITVEAAPASTELGMAEIAPPSLARSRATIHVTRDPAAVAASFEVVLAATSADGRALPRLAVEMPGGTDDVVSDIEPRYAGAKLDVIDVSPFPKACPAKVGGCVQLVSPPAL